MASAWHVEKIPIFEDNFIFVIHNTKVAILVDPGAALPAVEFLKKSNLKCQFILITHHHPDHVLGVDELKNKYSCDVYVPFKNKMQLSGMATHWVREGELISYEDISFEVIELPGHTLGHVAYWSCNEKWLFSGDVLFSLGCGRLFEGSFEQMFSSLQKINSLPDETLIFCTHDYFPSNQRFCRQEKILIEGYARLHPLSLELEKKFNPFLTVKTVSEFQSVRERRNQF